MKNGIFQLLLAGVMLCGCVAYGAGQTDPNVQSNCIMATKMPVDSIDVIHSYPHDSDAFTQGLLVQDGFFYESTGLYGKSGIFKKEIATGKTLKEIWNDPEYFGEGIVIFQNKIYQLTWQNEWLFLYDARSLQKIKKIHYRGEGWGLTTDGRYLFMSNGSSIIAVRDPETFRVIRKIKVRDGRKAIDRLNELEYVNGEIWANIFTEDFIARVSPENGKIKGWIDLSALRSYLPRYAQVDVINGIAYDQQNDRIFVTGKLWPKVFEIKIKEHRP